MQIKDTIFHAEILAIDWQLTENAVNFRTNTEAHISCLINLKQVADWT